MAKTFDGHFAVDRLGLRKLALRRGAGWVVTELLQTRWTKISPAWTSFLSQFPTKH